MAYHPNRKWYIDRAGRAGVIALKRGRRVIEPEDWEAAGNAGQRSLTLEQRAQLKGVSVSDVVVQIVARAIYKAR